MTHQNWTTSAAPSLPIDCKKALEKMREASEEMSRLPNKLITTVATFEKIKQACDSGEQPEVMHSTPLLFRDVFGMPVETCQTVGECLDRMLCQQDGERLQLMLTEEIPKEYEDHPIVKRYAENLVEHIEKAIYSSGRFEKHA